jgi:hypothetical protein
MRVDLIGGPGAGQSRTIVAYTGDANQEAIVDAPWTIFLESDKTLYQIVDTLDADREYIGLSVEQYHVVTTPQRDQDKLTLYYGLKQIDLTELAKVEVFVDRTGLSRNEIENLLAQNLGQQELQDGLANSFYINSTNENKPPMGVVIDDLNRHNRYFKIENLTIARLDRLNRFIRLARVLKWEYAELNWALNATEIDQGAIKSLSGIKRAQDQTGLDVVTLCSLWFDMKAIGKGDGPHPIDLFDLTFNNPALLKGQDPYKSVQPIPFDPNINRWLKWNPSENGVIRARLRGALGVNDDDLTRLGAAPCWRAPWAYQPLLTRSAHFQLCSSPPW